MPGMPRRSGGSGTPVAGSGPSDPSAQAARPAARGRTSGAVGKWLGPAAPQISLRPAQPGCILMAAQDASYEDYQNDSILSVGFAQPDSRRSHHRRPNAQAKADQPGDRAIGTRPAHLLHGLPFGDGGRL